MDEQAGRVLVADDDPAVLGLVAELLEEGGYAVKTASDGATALAAAESDPPDLVVSDVMMPRLDGLTLASRLRQRGIPVVLMSAVVERLPRRGVAIVTKPFDLDDLLAAVRTAVRRW